jgi:hypothetical protein
MDISKEIIEKKENIIMKQKELEDIINQIKYIKLDRENLEEEKKKLEKEKEEKRIYIESLKIIENENDIPDSELKIEEILKFRPKNTNEGLKEFERNLEEIKELLNQNDQKKITVKINYT